MYLGVNDQSVDAFVIAMNENAREIGLLQSYFLNPTGLDISKNLAGGYGSAMDIVYLLQWIFKNHPEQFLSTGRVEQTFISIHGFEHTFSNTNKLASYIPQLIGGKTGFEDLAGGNLVVVVDIGFEHPMIIVVLGSTEDGRFNDVEKLYNATLEFIIKN